MLLIRVVSSSLSLGCERSIKRAAAAAAEGTALGLHQPATLLSLHQTAGQVPAPPQPSGPVRQRRPCGPTVHRYHRRPRSSSSSRTRQRRQQPQLLPGAQRAAPPPAQPPPGGAVPVGTGPRPALRLGIGGAAWRHSARPEAERRGAESGRHHQDASRPARPELAGSEDPVRPEAATQPLGEGRAAVCVRERERGGRK